MIIKWSNHCDHHSSPDPLADLVDQVRSLSASGGFHQMGFLTKRCPHCVIDCKFFWVLLTKSSCIYDILYYFRLLTKRCPHVNVIYHIIFGIWPRDILMTYVYIIDYMGLLPPRSGRKTIRLMMLSKSWTWLMSIHVIVQNLHKMDSIMRNKKYRDRGVRATTSVYHPPLHLSLLLVHHLEVNST